MDRLVIVVHGHGDRRTRDAVVEGITLRAFHQAAERAAKLQHQRGDFGMQTLLVIHRSQEADRDDDEGLVLRRPDRYREAVDVRAPEAAGNDIATLAQRLPVRLDARLEDLRSLGRFRSISAMKASPTSGDNAAV